MDHSRRMNLRIPSLIWNSALGELFSLIRMPFVDFLGLCVGGRSAES